MLMLDCDISENHTFLLMLWHRELQIIVPPEWNSAGVEKNIVVRAVVVYAAGPDSILTTSDDPLSLARRDS